MADGSIQGVIRAYGTFDHTDALAQTVVSLTLPSVDGAYHILARVGEMADDAQAGSVATLTAVVSVNAGAAYSIAQAADLKALEVGTVTELDISGLAVRVRVTSANLRRSFAMIEAIGVEMTITPP